MNGQAVIESVWCVISDRSWLQVLSTLYKTVSQQSIPVTTLICDIVIEVEEVNDYESLATMEHSKTGLMLLSSDWVQIWVLLPDTVWIQNLSQWLAHMKQKYHLQGMVSVHTIKTDRKVVTLS